MTERSGPLVSVVLPTYGRPDYLVKAVRSVATQTYDPLELVVVDDCSPQPVEPQLSNVSRDGLERFEVRRHAQNLGANAARNTGIAAAKGEFVAFLDDDDQWYPEKIRRQVSTFDEAPDGTGVVYTGSQFVDEHDRPVGVSVRDLSGDITRELLCGASVGSFTRLMVRRNLLERVGRLDESLPGWQDRDLNIRLSRFCRYEPVPEPLVIHRRGTHTQIGDDYEGKRDVAYPEFVEKHRPLAATFGPDVERRFLAVQTLALAKSALTNGYTRAARRHAVEALGHDPTYVEAYVYLLFTLDSGLYRVAKRVKRTAERALGSRQTDGSDELDSAAR